MELCLLNQFTNTSSFFLYIYLTYFSLYMLYPIFYTTLSPHSQSSPGTPSSKILTLIYLASMSNSQPAGFISYFYLGGTQFSSHFAQEPKIKIIQEMVNIIKMKKNFLDFLGNVTFKGQIQDGSVGSTWIHLLPWTDQISTYI